MFINITIANKSPISAWNLKEERKYQKITPTIIVVAVKNMAFPVVPIAVDAVSKAVSNIMGPGVTLKEYNLKAITGGTNALADVTIKIEDKKHNVFSAEAVNEDVIMASAEALIKGINKALSFKKVKEKEQRSM